MGFQVTELSTIRICVNDVSATAGWVKSFFNVEPIEELENFVSFKILQTTVDIAKADEKSPQSLGGSIGYWLVNNLENALIKAHQLGAKTYRGPLRVEETRRTIVQIVTPTGIVIGLEAEF